VETNTHIKLHSDIDLLVIVDDFVSLEAPQVPASPYQGDPLAELKRARLNSFSILDSTYDQVDDSKPKSIQVFPTNPKRKVDVVVCNWYDSNEYVQQGRQETYRGIRIYDKQQHTRGEDFPFLNIARINAKDSFVNSGLRRSVRILKTLKEDADYIIDLTSFEITSLVFDISDEKLLKSDSKRLFLLNELSGQLETLINNHHHRRTLLSPNKKELVFGADDSKVIEIKKLKTEVDDLRNDIIEELNSGILLKSNIETDVYY